MLQNVGWMRNGFIYFFIQFHLKPFCFQSLTLILLCFVHIIVTIVTDIVLWIIVTLRSRKRTKTSKYPQLRYTKQNQISPHNVMYSCHHLEFSFTAVLIDVLCIGHEWYWKLYCKTVPVNHFHILLNSMQNHLHLALFNSMVLHMVMFRLSMCQSKQQIAYTMRMKLLNRDENHAKLLTYFIEEKWRKMMFGTVVHSCCVIYTKCNWSHIE